MKHTRLPLFALLAAALALPLVAAPPKVPPKKAMVPAESIVESTAQNVVLPSGADGIVVFRECTGCPPRSLRTSAETAYHFNQQAVTLGELKATLARLPETNINVVISGKTHELISLDAVNERAIDARPRAKRK